MDGAHTARALRRGDRAACCTRSSTRCSSSDVALEGMLLKPNMVIAGQRLPTAGLGRGGGGGDAAHAARGTCRPPCPASSSCRAGRITVLATEHLDAINQLDGAEAVEAELLVRPRAAGRGARGLARQGARTSRPASAPSITAPSATAPRRSAGTAASMESEAASSTQRQRRHAVAHPVDDQGIGSARHGNAAVDQRIGTSTRKARRRPPRSRPRAGRSPPRSWS